MFTGLIRDIGTVSRADHSPDGSVFTIQTGLDLETIPLGASIACSGCCLTMTEKAKGHFTVEASQETLSLTNLGSWETGTRLNLEPSLKLSDELGGHFVFGHIDGKASIDRLEQAGNAFSIDLSVSDDLSKFIAKKGSVALDGISLTVNEVSEKGFSVTIIPHTWENTTLQFNREGDLLHFEADMLARYVVRYQEGIRG